MKEHNEIFNAASHFAGFILAIAGLASLVAFAAAGNKPVHIVSFSIYGASLCLLFLSSSVYHYFNISGSRAVRKILQRVDHCAIYLLIAGSYTPLCLVILKGGWGRGLFAGIWGLAATGITLKIFMKNAEHSFSYALYIIMGWLAVVAIVPMSKAMTSAALAVLFAGGVSYTLGAILLGLKKPRIKPGVFGYHEVWHLFVLAGSGFHFALMFFFVLPSAR